MPTRVLTRIYLLILHLSDTSYLSRHQPLPTHAGSNEEKADIKAAYLESEGSIAHILSHVPHTTYEDEGRLADIVNSLIGTGTLPTFSKWATSLKDTKSRATRQKQGAKEAVEAEEAAKELGVWDEFYGSGKPGERKKTKKSFKGGKKNGDTGAAEEDDGSLSALILKRAEKRKADASDFLDSLATKYGTADEQPENKRGKGKGKKRASTETDDEQGKEDVMSSPKKKKSGTKTALRDMDDAEFATIQAKLFGPKTSKTVSKAPATSSREKARKGKRSS